jgi:hypothetical protein
MSVSGFCDILTPGIEKPEGLTWTFITHLYKSFSRSSSAGKDTALQVMLGFIIVVLAGYCLMLGFALEKIITHTLGKTDAIGFLNSVLIYFFLHGFFMRYFFQALPTLHAQPYLHLPISKSKIAHFLACKSLVHVINLSVFLIFTPFAFGAIATAYGVSHAWTWLLSLWMMSIANHFMVMLAKRGLGDRAWKLLLFLLAAVVVAFADYTGTLRLSRVSEKLFTFALTGYGLPLILLAVVIMLYLMVYRSFSQRLYASSSDTQVQSRYMPDWSFLHRFGLVGAWARVELKLIFRHKRSRELFLMHIIFVLLPLGFYSYASNRDSYGSFLFFALISSGFFTMNYGQFLFSWQGGHFDFTLLQPSALRQFVASKYWLMVSTTTLWLLLSIPYVFLEARFLFILLASGLYNMGINTVIVMNMSMWGAKKINLSHTGTLNMEGLGAAQWLMGLPLMASPYLFYLPFTLAGYPAAGIACVGLAGVVGLLLHKETIQFTTRRLLNKRYLLASNFRQD